MNGTDQCMLGDCSRHKRYLVTWETVESIKERPVCRWHRELVLQSPNAHPGPKRRYVDTGAE